MKRKKHIKAYLFVIFMILIACAACNRKIIVETLGGASNSQAKSTMSMANTQNEEWNLILVNKWNPIPKDYEVNLTELANGKSVDKRIYPYLQDMFDDARAQGIYPVVASGYRSAEDQQSIMDEKVEEFQAEGYSLKEAQERAEEWVAIPGTSEHQLGIAVDINANTDKSTASDVYNWLAENSYKYGFILRYPSDKVQITGISYESWHYRYVGKDAAKEIYERGICLEEYLD